MNLGAFACENSGLYFSWGNIVGVDSNNTSAVENMTENAYDNSQGYSVNTDLTDENDAARVYLGNGWSLPSEDDIKELLDYTHSSWTSYNGIPGIEFKSLIEGNNNTIFIPASGYIYNGEVLSVGSELNVWSKSIVDTVSAKSFFANEENEKSVESSERYMGFSIRPIYNS